MYHSAVRRVARSTYRALSRGDYQRVVRSFAPEAVLSFAGDHELGGTFHGPNEIRAWFERLFSVFPDLRLDPEQIVVAGPPWNTWVTTRFRVAATLPDGADYTNEGIQLLNIRWGRVYEERLVEDTEALVKALQVVSKEEVQN